MSLHTTKYEAHLVLHAVLLKGRQIIKIAPNLHPNAQVAAQVAPNISVCIVFASNLYSNKYIHC